MKRNALALTAALLIGCAGEAPTGVIDRDAFVAAWVDLRVAAAQVGERAPPPQERDRVLREHGVSEEQLLEFVDAYGADPRFMLEVWADVEERLRPPLPPDSVESPTG